MQRSKDYADGYLMALLDMSTILETRTSAISCRTGMRIKDIKLIINIIDAIIRRRETVMDVGIKKMNMFIRKDKTVDLKEK